MQLRQYQKECIDVIEKSGSGKFIINLPVGAGKTVIFSSLPRKGKTLIIAHREELLRQAAKYYNCPVGFEQGSNKSNNEEVICSSIQSLHNRFKKFQPDEFHTIIYDEVHRIMGKKTFETIQYFKPYRLLGFSATISRSDGVGLNHIFDKIIYQKDIRWMIENGYLCDIKCLRANVGYDLSRIKTKLGDFDSKELNKEMIQMKLVKSVADAYYKYAKGLTIIFACSVKHAELISKFIPESEYLTGETKNRNEILNNFRSGKTKCLININILTEGFDLPEIETVLFARPTKSQILYIQSIGRGLRLHKNKKELTLIDIVGNTGNHSLCTAPTLLGIDMSVVPKSKQDEIQGNIFELPDKIELAMDTPDSWIRNIEIVNLFAKSNGYSLHDVNYFKIPNGDLVVSLKDRKWYKIDAIDKLERTAVSRWDGKRKPDMKAQDAFDFVYILLQKYHSDERYIWDLKACKSWGRYQATDKQKLLVERFYPDVDVASLTKLQASQILNRRFMR